MVVFAVSVSNLLAPTGASVDKGTAGECSGFEKYKTRWNIFLKINYFNKKKTCTIVTNMHKQKIKQ